MKTRILTTRPASTALAAVLAFTPVVLFAQEAPTDAAPAEPVLTAPPEAVAPDPVLAPVVEAPTAATPALSEPVAQAAAPVSERAAPNAGTTRTRTIVRTTSATTAPSRMIAPTVAAPEVAAIADPVAPVSALPGTVAPATPVAVEPMPAEPRESALDTQLALILGGLAALALIGWGVVAAGRRRTPAQRISVPVVERPLVTLPDRPIVAERAAVAPLPFTRPTPAAPALSHTGAAVALPRALPATYEEREALLKRLVDARPDRANPFTDRRARMRRARLIMASLGRTFERPPRIDLSQYPENWPELRTMTHSQAA